MAFSVGDLVAHIKADVSDFKAGIGEAKTSAGTLNKTMENMVNTSKTLAKSLAVAGLAAGAAAIAFGKQSVEAAAAAEVEMAKVNALLKTMPADLEKNQAAVAALSESYIKLGFDDEETSLAMAKSLAVTHDLSESTKEMGLAADFARLKGIGIAESQSVLQMAYMGNQRVLKQYGIELSDTATKAEIFAAVENVAGGQAQAFAETYQGKLDSLKVSYGNLQEEVGGRVIPVLTQLMDWVVNTAIPNIQQFTTFVTEHKDALIAVAIGITAMLVPAFVAWAAAAIPAAIATIAATAPLIILGAAVTAVAYLIITNWDKIVAATVWLKDQVVAGFNAMVNKLKEVGGKILDAIMWPFEEAKRRIQDAVNFIKDRLDFTQRHSPSVLDIVQRGVHLVNNALSDLPTDINIGTNVALAGATAAGTTNQMAVTVDMAGAVIGDMSQAQRLAETVGDTIIKRLKLNVRF